MADEHKWAELSDGDEFAGYRIERRLGRGGMGILYLALEPGLERHVALKLIAPEAAADDVFTRRFAEESRIAAAIEHPNVVPIYAAGEQDGIPYIAMRFVSGSDLGRRISRDGKLEPELAVNLIAQIGNGLDAIHAAGLVHRDVKPANVLLSGSEGSEHAYITDFGVARNVATQSGLTQTGRFVGTLDYVAPEQISGGPIDARVDVYALGCLLYKLLTGEVPFPREGEAARLYAHLNDPPPAPSLFVPEVPMALDDVVIRAMSKPPEDRFPSAGDLGRAAVAALGGTAVSIPERTVATGAAATVESAIVKPRERTETVESGPPTASETSPSGVGGPPTDATERIDAAQEGPSEAPTADAPPAKPPDGSGPSASVRRRRLIFGGGVAAVIGALVVVIVLASGGGGGGGTSAPPVDTVAQQEAREEKNAETKEAQAAEAAQRKKEREEQTLTQAQLVSEADAICTISKENFKASQGSFPNGEEEANVAYSKDLLRNSTRALRELEKLQPPGNVDRTYAHYVELQEEVVQTDADALKAARNEDITAYLDARNTRNEGNEERQQVAEAIGFNVCSIPGG